MFAQIVIVYITSKEIFDGMALLLNLIGQCCPILVALLALAGYGGLIVWALVWKLIDNMEYMLLDSEFFFAYVLISTMN